MTWTLALSNLQTAPADTRVVCRICGYRFEPIHRKVSSQYCSPACREVGNQARKRESKERYEAKRIGITRICPHCSKPFSPATKAQRFCSVSCASLNRHSAATLCSFRKAGNASA